MSEMVDELFFRDFLVLLKHKRLFLVSGEKKKAWTGLGMMGKQE